ncbi:MAG: 6,7-dimethyl-8-ribityllumazine synthase [Actinomycetia bacterium]|nr:6,7-dimethyl-8-ribityllumazine synthase [Actinomycetes bacterium]MCP4957813.1 6,7-dimethyl-8-ribityllumazine synthase [Actinomycetes bacterium]
MSEASNRPELPEQGSAAGLRIGVVRSRWNVDIVDRLASGVERALAHCGAVAEPELCVPGALEIPFAADGLARSGRVDGIVAIGAVIRGETTHYELVSQGCLRGLQEVQLATGVPIGFGLVTVENIAQALARSEGSDGHNVGGDATFAVVELVQLRRRFSWR